MPSGCCEWEKLQARKNASWEQSHFIQSTPREQLHYVLEKTFQPTNYERSCLFVQPNDSSFGQRQISYSGNIESTQIPRATKLQAKACLAVNIYSRNSFLKYAHLYSFRSSTRIWAIWQGRYELLHQVSQSQNQQRPYLAKLQGTRS